MNNPSLEELFVDLWLSIMVMVMTMATVKGSKIAHSCPQFKIAIDQVTKDRQRCENQIVRSVACTDIC